jgi:hypothetical protein
MPSASRNANRKRRQKRKISLLTRELTSRTNQLGNHQFVLLSILMQAGGTCVVSPATTREVLQHFGQLAWRTEAGESGDMRVVMQDTRVIPEFLPEEPGEREDHSVAAQLARAHAETDQTDPVPSSVEDLPEDWNATKDRLSYKEHAQADAE